MTTANASISYIRENKTRLLQAAQDRIQYWFAEALHAEDSQDRAECLACAMSDADYYRFTVNL